MDEQGHITLDFTACQYISDLYRRMATAMAWEDWYGHNLDALWDILTGLPHEGNDFTILRPRHDSGIPQEKDAAFDGYIDSICAVFRRAQHAGFLSVHIEYR